MTEYFYGNKFIFGDNKPSTEKITLAPTLTAEFEIKGPVNFTNTGEGPTILIDGEDFENSISITALSDVDTTSLQNNDTLTYNSVDQTFVNTALKLVNLSDVNITSIQNNETLTYNSGSQKYINTPFKIENLTDVNITSIQDNEALLYDSGTQKFVNTELTLSNLADVDLTSIQNYDTIIYNSTSQNFENVPLNVESLEDFEVKIPGYVIGDVIRYDGTKWENYPIKMTNLKDVFITDIQDKDVLLYDSATEKYLNDGVINKSYNMLQSVKEDFTPPATNNVLMVDENFEIDNRPFVMTDISNVAIDTGLGVPSVISTSDDGVSFQNISLAGIGLPDGSDGDTLYYDAGQWNAVSFADNVISVVTTSVAANFLTDIQYTSDPFTSNTALVWNTGFGAWSDTDLSLKTCGFVSTTNNTADTNAPICFVNLSGNQDSQSIKTNANLYANLSTGSLNCSSLNLTGNLSATSASFTGPISCTSATFSGKISATSAMFSGPFTCTTFSSTYLNLNATTATMSVPFRLETNLAGDLYEQIKNTNTSTGSASFIVKVDPTSTGDPKIKLSIDGTNEYEYSLDNSVSDVYLEKYNTTEVRKVNSSGHNFYDNQPAFMAYLGTTVSNVTGDNTSYKILFDSITLNRGGVYNTGTGNFTAPATGVYNIIFSVYCTGVDAAHTICTSSFTGTTTYVTNTMNGSARDSNNNLKLNSSAMMLLTSGETVSCTISFHNGAKTVDVYGDGTTRYTYFQAYFLG